MTPCATYQRLLAETLCEHASYKLRSTRQRIDTTRPSPAVSGPRSRMPTAPSAPAQAPPCLRSERRPTMPLHVPSAPAPALRSVLAALGSPTAVREAKTSALRSVQGPLSPELPLPVHVLDRITPARTAPLTRLAAWRFLIRSEGRAVAAADTVLTPDGWTFSHFFEGPYLASTELAVRQAEASAPACQARLLSIPELYMLTLWLHGDTDADPAAWGARADGRPGAPGAVLRRASPPTGRTGSPICCPSSRCAWPPGRSSARPDRRRPGAPPPQRPAPPAHRRRGSLRGRCAAHSD